MKLHYIIGMTGRSKIHLYIFMNSLQKKNCRISNLYETCGDHLAPQHTRLSPMRCLQHKSYEKQDHLVSKAELNT